MSGKIIKGRIIVCDMKSYMNFTLHVINKTYLYVIKNFILCHKKYPHIFVYALSRDAFILQSGIVATENV